MIFYSGLPETRCGIGSTLRGTENIRKELPGLFRELGIKSLIDAPCGDFHWLSKVDLSGIDYVGYDDDQENLTRARKRKHNAKSARFHFVDLTANLLPKADLVLCKELLQHLPNNQVRRVLSNFSGKYLLATSHNNEVNKDIDRPGGFRQLNLRKPPFDFPEPIRTIADRASILGLWNCEG